MAAGNCPLRFSSPPNSRQAYFLRTFLTLTCRLVCLSLHLSVETVSSHQSVKYLLLLLSPSPSLLTSPDSHSFISRLLLSCCLCVCVCVCVSVRPVCVCVSAEWMEPSCRSCQSHCREMRSGCSEDTQHLSGSLQIWALQAGVCVCLCACVWACTCVRVCGHSSCVWAHEEATRLEVCVCVCDGWQVLVSICLYSEL